MSIERELTEVAQASAEPSELPPMPILPKNLINLISEYGMARFDGVTEIERIHRWELLIGGIKEFASAYAVAAIAAQASAAPEDENIAALYAKLFADKMRKHRLRGFEQGPEYYINDAIRHALIRSAPAASAAPVAPGWVSVKDRLPDVADGEMKGFIVACRREHNGKTYVFEALYLNNFPLCDANNDDEERPFTGWHSAKEHHDYDGFYEPINNESDAVTHWMPKPAAPKDQS